MKIKIIAVGKIKEQWIKSGIDEYLKRLRNIEIIEIKDSIKKFEMEKIKTMCRGKVYVLDETGREMTSVEFSNIIKDEISFVIGGPDGTDDSLKKEFELISLSKMTFTHEMARLFLIEQIYRAKTIQDNKNYHR